VLKRLLLLTIIGLAFAPPVVAQEFQPPTPEQLKVIESVNTKEKLLKVINKNYNVGISETWPKNFPLPVYTSNLVSQSFSHSTKGRPNAGATLVTSDQPRQVFDFYKAACQRGGWKLKVPSAKALTELGKTGEMYLLAADQPKQSIYLTCRKNKENNGTTVSISWSKTP